MSQTRVLDLTKYVPYAPYDVWQHHGLPISPDILCTQRRDLLDVLSRPVSSAKMSKMTLMPCFQRFANVSTLWHAQRTKGLPSYRHPCASIHAHVCHTCASIHAHVCPYNSRMLDAESHYRAGSWGSFALVPAARRPAERRLPVISTPLSSLTSRRCDWIPKVSAVLSVMPGGGARGQRGRAERKGGGEGGREGGREGSAH